MTEPRATTGRIPAGSRRVLFVTAFYQEEALLGVVDFARHRNWELISNMRFHGMLPSETEADGILVLISDERLRDWLAGWRDTPVVHIGTPRPALGVPVVDVDFTEAGRAGAHHFLELGHVNFAYYTLLEDPESELTRQAFEETLADAGRSAEHLDFARAHGAAAEAVPREDRLAWLADRLAELKKPLAVMSGDDRRSLELVLACERLGLRIPEDVSILGCENRSVEVNMSAVPLSSVDMNWRLTGRRAAETLDRLMAGQPVAPLVQVPPLGVIGRASTATFVTGSQEITRALLHIRQHYQQPIRQAELARLAGMSERRFRAEFRQRVGHSAQAEIRRVRLVAALKLLRDTEHKLDRIAFESGLGNGKKLCDAFAEDYGITPTRWRMQAREAVR